MVLYNRHKYSINKLPTAAYTRIMQLKPIHNKCKIHDYERSIIVEKCEHRTDAWAAGNSRHAKFSCEQGLRLAHLGDKTARLATALGFHRPHVSGRYVRTSMGAPAAHTRACHRRRISSFREILRVLRTKLASHTSKQNSHRPPQQNRSIVESRLRPSCCILMISIELCS